MINCEILKKLSYLVSDKIKRKKRCHFFIEKNNTRCQKKALWGTNFCWLHYPKKGSLIVGAIGSIFIGLVITILFKDPLTHFLSKYRLLYFIDKDSPVIEDIIPDIRKLSTVAKNTNIFTLSCVDKDSGINTSRSYIKIRYRNNQGYELVKGRLDISAKELKFVPEKDLEYGQYSLEAYIVDNANNVLTSSYSFVVKETEDLAFSADYHQYDASEHADFFPYSIIEGHERVFDFYVCTLWIKNITSGMKIQNITVSIKPNALIFGWKEYMSEYAVGIEAYDRDKKWNQNRSHFWGAVEELHIGEIAPQGYASFIILLTNSNEKREFKEKMDISGTYVCEGYGGSEVKKINLSIPIVKLTRGK